MIPFPFLSAPAILCGDCRKTAYSTCGGYASLYCNISSTKTHIQLAADTRLCTADIALHLTEDSADITLLFPLQDQETYLTLGGREFGKEHFHFEHTDISRGIEPDSDGVSKVKGILYYFDAGTGKR